MNTFAKLLVAAAVATALVGCAERSEDLGTDSQTTFDANGNPVSGEPGIGAAVGTFDVQVQSTPRGVETGATESVVIRAVVVDLQNQVVPGTPVAFSASNGVLSGVATETDAAGVATASLELVDDFRNQDIVVTVEALGSTGETVVRADGSAIQVSGATKVAAGMDASLDLALTTGTGEPIRNESIAIEVTEGTLGLPTEATTGNDGRTSITVTDITVDSAIRLTALDGTVTAVHALESLAPGEEPGLGAASGSTLDVRVQSSRQRLITGSTDADSNSTTITAFVVDLDNRAIADRAVTFSSSNGVLQNVSAETDENGVATATLRLLDDYRTQDIVVSVTADGYDGQTIVRADGSGFTVEGPTKVVAGNAADLEVVLTSGANTPIPGQEIRLRSSVGNTITPAVATTDADGRVAVRVSSAAGTDTLRLTALDGTVVGSHELEVLTDSLSFAGIAPDANLLVGEEHALEVTWVRAGQAVVSRPLTITTTTGRIVGQSSLSTDAAGRVTFRLLSDQAGSATITVRDSDGEPSESFDVEFIPALDVRVLSDVNRIETGGSDVANITALVTDVDNKSVANTPVRFSATGGVLQNVSSETDENGVASATLKLLQDFRTQDIVVTVTADDFEGDVSISADGSELEVAGPASLVEGADAELVVVLSAGNGEPISNERILFESVAGNRISPSSAVTDADGRVDVSVQVTTSALEDTIRMLALDDTVVASHSFTISTDSLAFDIPVEGREIPVGTTNPGEDNDVTVTWTRQGQPVAGRDLRFSSTAGRIAGSSTVTTNAAGEATIRISSASAGSARLTVEDAATGEPSAQADIEFVATTPARVAIDASSSRVPSQGTSVITAFITDADGNPVKGREVVFGSGDLKGGRLSPSSATSGSDGEASVTFTAGADATTFEEIELVAEVQDTDIVDTMRLTVIERVLNVTIGTSNEVDIEGAGTQYAMPFVVQVADGSGTPLENAEVVMSVRPLDSGIYNALRKDEAGNFYVEQAFNAYGERVERAAYGKGSMELADDRGFQQRFGDDDWAPDHWVVSDLSVGCESEDRNLNRILDIMDDANGNYLEDDGPFAGERYEPNEDFNKNGSLDPQDPASLTVARDPDAATLSGGVLTTDSNGSGYFRLTYPASNALWAHVEITARAEALGAEAEDSFRTTLLLPAVEANDKDSLPANARSPYGVDPDCSTDQ